MNDNLESYDAAVVVAESEDDARTIHPHTIKEGDPDYGYVWGEECKENDNSYSADKVHNFNFEREASNDWFSGLWLCYKKRNLISVKYLGVADSKHKRGVILASYNAG